MLRHLPKGSIFQSYRIGKLVKERPYGDPLHRCSLTLTAVPLYPVGEALATSLRMTQKGCAPDVFAWRVVEDVDPYQRIHRQDGTRRWAIKIRYGDKSGRLSAFRFYIGLFFSPKCDCG